MLLGNRMPEGTSYHWVFGFCLGEGGDRSSGSTVPLIIQLEALVDPWHRFDPFLLLG